MKYIKTFEATSKPERGRRVYIDDNKEAIKKSIENDEKEYNLKDEVDNKKKNKLKKKKKFESIVEYKPEYQEQIFDNIFHLVDHAQDYLSSMGFEVDEDMAPEDAIIELRKVNTDIAKELADEIDKMLELLAEFDVESEIEQSKLN